MLIWKDLVKILAAEHHLILIDLPGHGKTSKAIGRYPPARMAYAVLDTIKKLKLNKPVLLGNSLGGATAIEVAMRVPDKIEAIVLLGSPGGEAHPLVLRKLVKAFTHAKNIKTVSPQVVHLLWLLVAQTLNPLSAQTVDTAWIHPRGSREWPLFARAMSASIAALLHWNPTVEEIGVPTLVIQGAADVVVWPWQGERFAARVPDAEFKELSGCGHFPQLQCLEDLVEALKPFLQRHTPINP
jgi:pimeloyl-ACP methyl ester carboxylesterase